MCVCTHTFQLTVKLSLCPRVHHVITNYVIQVLSILNALSANKESLMFMGSMIKCNHNCGIFITMNPGYAGRTELPDNLKVLSARWQLLRFDLEMAPYIYNVSPQTHLPVTLKSVKKQ